jgi:large subunit ribosomal protein L10
MLTKKQKEQVIEDLVDRIKRQKILVFTDFSGLKVSETRDLRKKLKEAGIDYKVAKKTLIKLALEKAKKAVDVMQFKSSVALVSGYNDPIMPAKIISQFSKEHDKLKILGGLIDNKVLTVEEIKELAKILSREELLAKLVWSIKSPVSGFVNVLRGNLRNLMGILTALQNK